MTIFLTKDHEVDITKDHRHINHLVFGLGWDPNEDHKNDDEYEFDLDISAFLLGSNHRVSTDADLVFYGNPQHASGCAQISADSYSGAGEGDDETISIDLTLVPTYVQRIVIAVTIFDAIERAQSFEIVKNTHIRIVNADLDEEIIKFALDHTYDNETSLIFGELYRHDDTWKFKTLGTPVQGDLTDLCQRYGVDV